MSVFCPFYLVVWCHSHTFASSSFLSIPHHKCQNTPPITPTLYTAHHVSPTSTLPITPLPHTPQSERSLREVIQFLAVTELQHLDLGSCRVMVTVHEGVLARLSRQDDLLSALQEGVPPLHNNTLAFLNLDNFEASIGMRFWGLRGTVDV